jgi:hypothetical protein
MLGQLVGEGAHRSLLILPHRVGPGEFVEGLLAYGGRSAALGGG